MKKILRTILATILLLSPLLMANEKHYYKVEEVHSNKKGALGKTFYKIGDFCFSIIAGAIGNSDSAKQVIANIEVYFNNKSSNHADVLEQFKSKIHADIIEEFSAPKETYVKGQPINFAVALKQDAYVYLLNVSAKNSCLIYPNLNDQNPYQSVQGEYAIPSNDTYAIAADGRSAVEEFYLITAIRPLYFDKFKKTSIFKCASRGIAIQKVAKAQNSQYNEVSLIKLNIKYN